jgi:hypothetical protein
MLARASILSLAVLLAAEPVLAASAKPAAPKAAAKAYNPRDIDGPWDSARAMGLDPTTVPGGRQAAAGIPDPPLKPEYLAAWKAHRAEVAAANARGEPPATGYTHCLPDGMPATMMAMFPFEVLVSRGRITIIQEAYSQIRRIYLDEKQIPIEDAEPGFWGHSVGHWDGDVLKINTVGIKENVRFQDTPHSDKMQIDEELRMTSEKTMEDKVTVTDPVYLTGPWTWVWRYARKPGYKVFEYVCEDNREFADENGKARLKLMPSTVNQGDK